MAATCACDTSADQQIPCIACSIQRQLGQRPDDFPIRRFVASSQPDKTKWAPIFRPLTLRARVTQEARDVAMGLWAMPMVVGDEWA